MERENVNVGNKWVSIHWKSKEGPVCDLKTIQLGWHKKKRITARVAIDAMGNIEWITIRT